MIAIKGGTQTFSTAEQQSSLKNSNSNSIGVSDQKKYFGDKKLGDVLNQVADPNWVDPAKKVRQVGSNQLGKDAFLKLLLAQLKNQDPTNPLESHEMAAHLAQFSSLEKLEGIDQGINNLTSVQKPQEKFQTLNLIGRVVSGDSSKIIRTDETSEHTVTFNLPDNAKEVKIDVRDSLGNTVRTFELKDQKKGKNEFTWNGFNENGRAASEGQYTVSIEAKAESGKKLAAETKFNGKITGVNFTAEGPVLLIGKQSVRLSDVKKIIDSEVSKGEEAKPMNTLPSPQEAGKVKSTTKASSSAAVEQSIVNGGLSQVGMSREMINKLNKAAGQ